ncbi:MAG: COX15/CtaA family protein [Candidatus Omnitrophota bacterium]|nr:COX15/CtaA family protein [Candidatus Omnitrophota bacterium]MDZ4242690.1 COX15/CtaA family protein [Candidatus Omnitrophota bacterium]
MAQPLDKNPHNSFLGCFTKIVCFATLFLIFVGGEVTSHSAGLSVPDWPLSYGMLFPPMVGGVFYEHGHRMVATVVGFLTLCLAILLQYLEPQSWLRKLGFWTLGAVILQGILGGITVKFFLPTPVSVSHAVLAQTFLILTVILAYGESRERTSREPGDEADPRVFRLFIIFTALIYLQLILGAVMRHTASGLAIPDFPKMGDRWFPPFDSSMLAWINDWRFMNNYESVTLHQVGIHFLHRLMAGILAGFLIWINLTTFLRQNVAPRIAKTILAIDGLVLLQISLGILTVWTQKAPTMTSLHVVTGAATLALSVLLVLRAAPVTIPRFQTVLFHPSAI